MLETVNASIESDVIRVVFKRFVYNIKYTTKHERETYSLIVDDDIKDKTEYALKDIVIRGINPEPDTIASLKVVACTREYYGKVMYACSIKRFIQFADKHTAESLLSRIEDLLKNSNEKLI